MFIFSIKEIICPGNYLFQEQAVYELNYWF